MVTALAPSPLPPSRKPITVPTRRTPASPRTTRVVVWRRPDPGVSVVIRYSSPQNPAGIPAVLLEIYPTWAAFPQPRLVGRKADT